MSLSFGDSGSGQHRTVSNGEHREGPGPGYSTASQNRRVYVYKERRGHAEYRTKGDEGVNDKGQAVSY
jgi:hypothetical protein